MNFCKFEYLEYFQFIRNFVSYMVLFHSKMVLLFFLFILLLYKFINLIYFYKIFQTIINICVNYHLFNEKLRNPLYFDCQNILFHILR